MKILFSTQKLSRPIHKGGGIVHNFTSTCFKCEKSWTSKKTPTVCPYCSRSSTDEPDYDLIRKRLKSVLKKRLDNAVLNFWKKL